MSKQERIDKVQNQKFSEDQFERILSDIEKDQKQKIEKKDYITELKEEFSYLLDSDYQTAIRDSQIIELLSIMSEITNILNFDFKCVELKDLEIEQLKNKVVETERKKEGENESFKSKIVEEIHDVRMEYENKVESW